MSSSSAPTSNPKTKTNMTDTERAQVVAAVLALPSNGVPKKGVFVEVAAMFPFTVFSVRRVWLHADESAKSGGGYATTPRMRGRCGRRKPDRKANLERLRAVPPTQRFTIRSAAAAYGVPPQPLSTAACKTGFSAPRSA